MAPLMTQLPEVLPIGVMHFTTTSWHHLIVRDKLNP
jgi:hypothetical protein